MDSYQWETGMHAMATIIYSSQIYYFDKKILFLSINPGKLNL
jgi:hypothetical protein